MSTVKISKTEVDAAKPGLADAFLWDTELKGFGLKITPAGSKVYIYQYRVAEPKKAARTAAKRYTIGKHGDPFTPAMAREKAKELAGKVAAGVDPREEEIEKAAAKRKAIELAEEKARLEDELTFEKLTALWLHEYEHEKERRPSSVRLARLVVQNHLRPFLRGKPFPHIDRSDLQRVLDAIPVERRGIRRAVFTYASVLFGWATKRGDIPDNPLSQMAKPTAPRARDRVLDDRELALIWQASTTLGRPFGPFFRLLILTAQRRSEVAEMRWQELDRSAATLTIPAERVKNRKAHIVPLSPLAIAELDAVAGVEGAEEPRWPTVGVVLTTTGTTGISGFTKAKRALDAVVADCSEGKALPDWRVHDIRRTVATGFQRLGVRFEVTEAVLNHISGSKAGVAGIYQRHDWALEKRDALNAWARHIEELLETSGRSEILRLEGAGA
ncbi:tyrosine-type recombinase/integrase [Sphingomonas lutea]|uniref:tyrosine-type recombinase/integrase n=1 Tax=Sphingomonas lutea TaxID=1045317 RepID=UPI001F1E1359|nr:site-specific integrase [Sphingomonas lutea]